LLCDYGHFQQFINYIVKNGLFGEFWIEYLLPWVLICCAEPPFIGVFVHDHDEAVVPLH
jgi:hypothetical protein